MNNGLTRRLLFEVATETHNNGNGSHSPQNMSDCEHPICKAVCKDLNLKNMPGLDNNPDLMFGHGDYWQSIINEINALAKVETTDGKA